jgi:hypothetical protein
MYRHCDLDTTGIELIEGLHLPFASRCLQGYANNGRLNLRTANMSCKHSE